MNEIDRIMALDPLELSTQDIEAIIDYQRKHRLDHEAGIKPKKAGAEEKISGSDLLSKLGMVKPTQPLKRRA